MHSFLRGMKPHIKNVTPIYNTQPSPVFPNDEPHRKTEPPAQLGQSFDSNLKVTNRMLSNFQNFHNS